SRAAAGRHGIEIVDKTGNRRDQRSSNPRGNEQPGGGMPPVRTVTDQVYEIHDGATQQKRDREMDQGGMNRVAAEMGSAAHGSASVGGVCNYVSLASGPRVSHNMRGQLPFPSIPAAAVLTFLTGDRLMQRRVLAAAIAMLFVMPAAAAAQLMKLQDDPA